MALTTTTATTTMPSSPTNNVMLTASLDRAGELQIYSKGKPIESLEVQFKRDTGPTVIIQTFAGWTLAASHPNAGLITWEVDAAGNVSHTFAASGEFHVTVVATESSTAQTKTKTIKITVKPTGSDKGPGPGHS